MRWWCRNCPDGIIVHTLWWCHNTLDGINVHMTWWCHNSHVSLTWCHNSRASLTWCHNSRASLTWCHNSLDDITANQGIWHTDNVFVAHQISGLVQDCSISSALAVEILQSCMKPSKWNTVGHQAITWISVDQPIGEWMSECFYLINSSPPSATYMRQWIWSALVQIMACPLFCAKPLSEPMLG